MHAHEADLVERPHGRLDVPGARLLAGLGPEVHDELHGVVAEDAHAGLADNLAAGHVMGHVGGEEVEDGLGDPDAVDVDAVEHHVGAPEVLVLLDVGLVVM